MTVHKPDLANAVWRKSTRSSGNSACVEVAAFAGAVAVRDSKHRAGPALVVSSAEWRAFLHGARAGDFQI